MKEYIVIHTAQQRYVVYERMGHIESMLPQGKFAKIHKSYIVAIDKVKTLDGNMLKTDTDEIPVSRDLKQEAMQKIFGNTKM